MNERHTRPCGLVVACLFVACLFVSVLDAAAQAVGPNVKISTSAYLDHSPSVAALGDNLVAVWSDGTAVSRNGGITWAAATLPPGPSTRGQLSTCVDDNGTAFCAASAYVGNGYAVVVFNGSFDDPTWQWQRGPDATPPLPSGYPDGVRILCDRAHGILYVTYTHKPDDQCRTYLVRSTDGGGSWSLPAEVTGGQQCDTPQLELGPDGELYVVWRDDAQGTIVGRRSTDHGASFGPTFTLGESNESPSLPPPGWANGYREAPAFLGVAVDASTGPQRGTVYAVWTEHVLGTATEEHQRVVTAAREYYSFAGATPIEFGDNFVGFFSNEVGGCDLFTFEGTAGTTIYIIGSAVSCGGRTECRSTGFGVNLLCGDTTAVTVVGTPNAVSSPPFIYTLPTTGRFYLSIGCMGGDDPGGHDWSLRYGFQLREYVVSPGQVAQDHRDVVLVRSTDGGATWSEKIRVNDDAPMHDNAIPAVDVDNIGRVHVAWYDRRDAPECGSQVHTYWTWSEDGGATFQPSRRVSEQPSDGRSWPVGDFMALQAEGDLLHLLWTQIPIGGVGDIYGAGIDLVGSAPPDVVSLDPDAGAPGAQVELHGANLSGVRQVLFHRSPANFTIGSDGLIRAEVPSDARTGNVLVTQAPWSDSSPEVFFVAPRITALDPVQARIDDPMQIVGVNFTGATAVIFNEVAATFVVVSDTLITTTVPIGATEGPILISGPGGTGAFPFVPLPPFVSGINLSWDNCGEHGAAVRTFSCLVNRGTPFRLVASFTPPEGIRSLIRITADIRVISEDGPLPSWWQIPECRNPTDFRPTSVGASSCLGFTQAQSVGGQYEAEYEGPSHARLLVQVFFPGVQIGPLDPALEYTAFSVMLLTNLAAGGTCPGCTAPVRIELRSIQLHQPDEVGFSPVLTAALDRREAYWQSYPTPVLISGLAAESIGQTVELSWHASDVAEVREFRVHRAPEAGEYQVVGSVLPADDGEYRWMDESAIAGTNYRYQLEVVRHDGASLWDGPVEIVTASLPVTLKWRDAVPNPFEDAVVLGLDSPALSSTRVRVFDVTGHLVAELRPDGDGGRALVRWDGRNRSGNSVAPGIYLLRAEAEGRQVTRRVIRVR